MSSLLLDALKGKNKDRPPIWLMRQAGRYMKEYRALREKHSFLDLCHNPDLVTQVTHLPIDRFGFDAAIVFSDILMVPEAMGFNVRFDEGIGPIIDNPIVQGASFNLSYNPEKQAYLPQAINQLNASLKVPLIGFAGAPFTLACYLIEGKTSRDFRKVKKFLYQNPLEFEKLIDQLTDGVIEALKLQRSCAALQLFDSWAEVLPVPLFQKYCQRPLKKISKAVKELQLPLIYFCRGSSFFAPYIAETGVEAISLDFSLPPSEVRKQLPTICLQGNLDSEALLAPVSTVNSMTKELLQSMKGDPAYIFNLGHGILPDTPEDSVRALVHCLKNSC